MGYTVITGDQGAGKTLFMTMVAGQEARRMGKIAANYDIDFKPVEPLFEDFNPEDVDLYKFKNDLETITVELMHGRHIFIDDLQALFDCRFWDSIPPEIRLFFATHRHYQCQVTCTVPSWSRADKDIRLNTNRLLHIRRRGRLMFITEHHVKIDESDPEGQNMVVKRKRIFPKIIRLPFKPKDDNYPLLWRVIRKIAKVVGEMYDTWAPIELAPHLAKGKRGKKRGGKIKIE